MADFTRSVVWRFWAAMLLLSDMLVHLVRAATLEDHSDYQACLASPSTCTYLSVYDSNLDGTIPTELGLMTAMEYFDACCNNLDGTIPKELGLMTAMTYFWVNDNNLDGTIPTELELMTGMEWFYVHTNAGLCGPLVSVGSVGTNYHDGIGGTNLGTACPTQSPSASPTPPPDPSVDSDNRNGIMRAAMAGNTTELAVALADPVQNIDLMDWTTLGYNALMLAAQYDHQDVARMLLDAGADTSMITATQHPPLSNNENNSWSNVMVAAWYGDQEIMSMFLDASVEHLNTPCVNKQMTPLHGAMSQDHCNTAAILIDRGANVDAMDSDGRTPLHYAAKDGNYKCLMMLTNAGASESIVDDTGNTAYTLAEAGDHQDIMTALSIGPGAP